MIRVLILWNSGKEEVVEGFSSMEHAKQFINRISSPMNFCKIVKD